MAVITPQTDLYLLKSPLSMNGNTLNFKDKTAQANYFLSLPKIGATDFTYQRKDSTIRFPAQYDHVVEYNYVMYRNDAYSNKWFYAYITDMAYINDGMTAISISTDEFQTWQFDIDYHQCFIERAVPVHDEPNLVDEDFETGELYNKGFKSFDLTDGGVIMAVSDLPQGDKTKFHGTKPDGSEYILPDRGELIGVQYGRVYSGLIYLYFDIANNLEGINRVIHDFDADGKGDAIQEIFCVPHELMYTNNGNLRYGAMGGVNYWTSKAMGGLGASFRVLTPLTGAPTFNLFKLGSVDIESGLQVGEGSTWIKSLIYPYHYVYATNNAGSSAVFRFEDFGDYNAHFEIYGTLSNGGSIICVPTNYKGQLGADRNIEYALTGQKFPSCAWVTDTYTNWITQNAVNISTSLMQTENLGKVAQANQQRSNELAMTNSIIGAIGGTAGGFKGKGEGPSGMLSGAAGGLAGILQTGMSNATATANTEASVAMANVNATLGALAEKRSHELQPDQAHGAVAAGNIHWALESCGFSFYTRRTKLGMTQRLNSMFNTYGYNQNVFANPKDYINAGKTHAYIKTIACDITGDLPQSDIANIQDLFNAGITIWHDPATMYNYSANNRNA